jgi:hypothetical protein
MKKLEIGGLYEHFKGFKIRVICEAVDTETELPLVIYIHLEDGAIWARPKKMFLENVIKDGKKVERFKKIKLKVLVKPKRR